MSSSDPLDLDPDELPPQEGKILPFQRRTAPDWLTRPGDDVAAAGDFEDTEPSVIPLPAPVLTRPTRPAGPDPPAAAAARNVDEVSAPGAKSEAAPPAAAWAAAASSIPTLRMPLPPRDEGDALAPEPTPRAPRDLPGPAEDRAARTAPAPALQPLVEPWWMIALDALRTDWRVQAAVGGAIVMVLALGWWLWPRGVGSTSITDLRRHPKQYDGRTIDVRGRVGHDVFQVAGGYTFFLLQGRDTIVTFSRGAQPRPGEVVTVKGQISTGFLDGVPRQALFEAEQK